MRTRDDRARRDHAPLFLALLVSVCAVLDGLACLTRPAAPEPFPASASTRFAEERALAREGKPADVVRKAAEAVEALAPGWAAPERLVDDAERARLLGGEALEARLEALAEVPTDPTRAYLVGRLEGAEGRTRYERALSLDPHHAWALHGLAWTRFLAGDAAGAMVPGARAIAQARDPWERAHFLQAFARYALARGRPAKAVEVLAPELAVPPGPGDVALLPVERLELAALLAHAELTPPSGALLPDPEPGARGVSRALHLLSAPELDQGTLDGLVSDLLEVGGAQVVDEMRARLAQRGDATGTRLLARIDLERGDAHAGLALLRSLSEGGEGTDPGGPEERAALLAQGSFDAAIEAWLAALPTLALDAHGMPREPRLVAVVAAARAAEGSQALPAVEALGARLVDAGWFREAEGLARWLAPRALDASLTLAARARQGRSLVAAIAAVFRAVDHKTRVGGPWLGVPGDLAQVSLAPGAETEPHALTSLGRVLDALAPAVERALGRKVAEEVRSSPRIDFGPFATLVHPGPTYSAADQAAGRGEAGAPVPGLAHVLDGLGRFAIVGQVVGGGGPDGVLMRRLAVEHVQGEHLGVPYEGTVVLGQGQDLESRPGRNGARITGAAVHEGYWIDVESVREDLRRWRALQDRWLGPDPPAPPADVVAARGPRVALAGGDRRRAYAVDGVGDRVRLAVLLERAEQARSKDGGEPSGDLVPFDELLDAVARHEEGHLCDRTRFLPLHRHLGRVLALAAEAGFSPEEIARRIEYRAQLTALCVVADPRIPLAEVIDAVDHGNGITPHARAYQELLKDLLGLLDKDLENHPALDPAYFLVHQLPRLGAEEVRTLALALAERRGMVAE